MLLLFIFIICANSNAQVTPAQKDTIKEKQDKLYKNIENYSKRKKFTRFFHKLLFKPVQEKKPSRERRAAKGSLELKKVYNNYQGKIVRKINIQTLDPFGNSVTDSTQTARNGLERLGNNIHLKTKELTIRNLLLFKRNRPLDSLLVRESERLIRSQRYVRRVNIEPVAINNSKDSVDISIRVLDSWSLIPNGSASTTRTSFELTERNFFGLGHEFRNDFDKRFDTGETAYLARYTIPNIMNTYITAEINYELTMRENSLKSFGLNRDFFSAYTKWAGGIYFEERLVRDSLPNTENIFAMQNFKTNAQDYWAGYSFKIFKGNTEEDRTTNLVTTARFFNQNYTERPTIEYDSLSFFANEKLYMASIGLTSRKFVQDKFLFNYDIIEDIPIGKVYALTIGKQVKNNQNRLYLSGKYAFGNYYKWGYFSSSVEIGSFFYNDKPKESTLRIETMYFTNIREWGRWRFRHFIKPLLVFGDNRVPIIKDQLDLNGDNGIQGFDSRTLLGTSKLLLTLQTQSYAPWNVWGFRLNPFANITFGMIGDGDHKLYESNVYSKIGLGLLITNDYLVFNNFQLSFAFYPNIPGNAKNAFKTNTFKNTDLNLPDFQIAKPEIVPYR